MSTDTEAVPDSVVEIGTETFDLTEYDFPTRRDSPDPQEMINTILECGGVLDDVAANMTCSERTIYTWANRYTPVNHAVRVAQGAIGVEAKETMVELMRDEDTGDRTRLKAAKKLATTYHPHMDFSRRERREYKRSQGKKEDKEELDKEISEMDIDELLDFYNNLSNSD
jgi:hypothetical protein